jgi:pimeloyl-ACP methyl ester carboxylesterase
MSNPAAARQASQEKKPPSVRSEPTLLLIHGAWHNAQHWQSVVNSLRELGRRGLAIDLPGHGVNGPAPIDHDAPSTVALVSVQDAAMAVVEALRAERVVKPVLVGHSIGGVIITLAAELAPELIGHLVYVSGHAPIGLKSPAAYAQLPEWRTGYGDKLFIGNPAATGVVRIDPSGDTPYLEALRQAYYNDVAFDDFLPFARALTADLPLAFWIGEIAVTKERWGRIPRTYVRCTLDRALSPAIQSMMIREADELTPENRFHVIDLPSSHSPFASMPRKLAQILADAAVD